MTLTQHPHQCKLHLMLHIALQDLHYLDTSTIIYQS
jgi:hypothetical protein